MPGVLPPSISFNFDRLEIRCDYSDKQTTFGIKFDNIETQQSFVNIFGDPTVLNLICVHNQPSLDLAYPDEFTRIRFVKGILYVWVTYILCKNERLGVFSKLMDTKLLFEDYTRKELMGNVVIPILKSVRDGSKHLPDMDQEIFAFADIASRELEGFLVKEVDESGMIEEEAFRTEFQEKLNTVNSQLAIKAVQALNAADIDRISKIGETIEDLKTRKVDLPEFENLRSDFRNLCGKLDILSQGQLKLTPQPPSTVEIDGLVDEIRQQRERMESEIIRLNRTIKEIEEERKKAQLLAPAVTQTVQSIIPQQQVSHSVAVIEDPMMQRIMKNMNRRQMKVLEKVMADDMA